MSTPDLWVSVLASVIQFILDFAGYSNIARGTSKLLGIELPYNFRQPLTRSRNFRDFWRREHMTLMAWFRDYVYRPLHDQCRYPSSWRNQLALLVVFAPRGCGTAPRGCGCRGASSWAACSSPSSRCAACSRSGATGCTRRSRPTGPMPAGASRGWSPSGPPTWSTRPSAPTPPSAPTRPARWPRPRRWPSAGRRTRLIDQQWVRAAYIILLAAVQVAWVRTGTIAQSLDLYRHLLIPSGHGVDVDSLMLLIYALDCASCWSTLGR